jgi:hypothetical protein
MDSKNIKKLAKAIAIMESYLARYTKPVYSALSMYQLFNLNERKGRTKSVVVSDMLKCKHNHNHSTYTSCIQKKYPTLLLHYLFQHATKIVGNDAKTKHIIHHMNKKHNNHHPNCPICGTFKLTNYLVLLPQKQR